MALSCIVTCLVSLLVLFSTPIECLKTLKSDVCALVLTTGGPQVQWMTVPQEVPPGCPPGLEYLTQVDQILVHQQVDLFESMQW